MRKFLNKPIKCALAITLCAGTSMASYAESSAATTSAVNKVVTWLNNNLQSALDTWSSSTHRFGNKSLAYINGLSTEAMDDTNKFTMDKTIDNINVSIGPPIRKNDGTVDHDVNPIRAIQNIISGTDYSMAYIGVLAGAAPGDTSGTDSMRKKMICQNLNFDFDALMGTDMYTTKDLVCGTPPNDSGSAQPVNLQFAAENFIKYSAALGKIKIDTFTPFQALDTNNLSSGTQAVKLHMNEEYQKFVHDRRGYLSSQSVGLSNLYYLMALRTGKTTNNGKDVEKPSSMMLSNQIANSRTSDPTWYADVQTAYPASVAREAVYILAEMQKELHDMRVENQRILATLSVQLLQQVAANASLAMDSSKARREMRRILNEGN